MAEVSHPPITIYVVASLHCPACNMPVSVERLQGSGEKYEEAAGYTKGDLIAEYTSHVKREHDGG